MKCLFLYNPKSGREKIQKNLDYIIKRLSEKFSNIDIHPSSSKEDFIEIAKLSCGKYDYLIFSGGDGSFNLVVNAIAECDNKPILGYIPSGTCNDIANNLRIPSYSLKKCLDVILENKIVDHDIMKVNDSYCMYVAALGDLAELSFDTEHNLKKIFGRVAYYFSGAKKLFKEQYTHHLKITVDGVPYEYETALCLVVNSKYIASLKFNSNGYHNDGKVDIIIVKGKTLKGLINIFRLFIFGILKIKTENTSYVFRSNKFTIEPNNEKYWAFDGEKGKFGKLEFEVLPKHIKVIGNLK